MIRSLWRARRASIGLFVALLTPVLLGVGLLAVDATYLYYRTLLLRQTAQAAALAGGGKLSTYFTTGSSATVVSTAQTFSTANSPTARFGTVVPTANVVLGNWDGGTSTFTSLASSGGTLPNAVSVTALNTTANGNPVATFLAGRISRANMDLTSTVVTSYGTGQPFHTIVINDLSSSFSSSIANQRAADVAILDCVKNSAGSGTQFGLIGFTGHYGAVMSPPLQNAATSYSTIKTTLNALKSCGNTGMPACSGSNVAAAIYRSMKSDMFGDPALTGTPRNLVIITDGVPNANSFTYTKEDGIFTLSGGTAALCTSRCTDANLLTAAQYQAGVARGLGISVSTIYYSGNTTSATDKAAYAASLATLTGGVGISLVTPTTAGISNAFAAFCSTMSSVLKLVN